MSSQLITENWDLWIPADFTWEPFRGVVFDEDLPSFTLDCRTLLPEVFKKSSSSFRHNLHSAFTSGSSIDLRIIRKPWPVMNWMTSPSSILLIIGISPVLLLETSGRHNAVSPGLNSCSDFPRPGESKVSTRICCQLLLQIPLHPPGDLKWCTCCLRLLRITLLSNFSRNSLSLD